MTSREIGLQLGVSHTAINKAARRGRIPREPDGSFNLERVRQAFERDVRMRLVALQSKLITVTKARTN
jgi:hypothetical protein